MGSNPAGRAIHLLRFNPRGKAIRYFVLAAGLWFVAIGAPGAFAGEGELRESHRGVTLIAVPPAPGFDYDIEIIDGRQALDKLRDALDVLLDKSPYSAAAIERLGENGEIILVYNPSFPETVVSGNQLNALAVFRAGLVDSSSGTVGALVFPVMISRYLAKWPRDQVAAGLAHELVGHGIQYLEGRLGAMEPRDRECEANLYTEMVFQDLGVDKRSRFMTGFRQSLEWFWCKSFKDYMAAHRPQSLGLWKQLNPDVPELIIVFKQYVLSK